MDPANARFHHPIWTKLGSTLFVACGAGLLGADVPIIAVPLIFYGAGIGIESIARGTLPLICLATRHASEGQKLCLARSSLNAIIVGDRVHIAVAIDREALQLLEHDPSRAGEIGHDIAEQSLLHDWDVC